MGTDSHLRWFYIWSMMMVLKPRFPSYCMLDDAKFIVKRIFGNVNLLDFGIEMGTDTLLQFTIRY